MLKDCSKLNNFSEGWRTDYVSLGQDNRENQHCSDHIGTSKAEVSQVTIFPPMMAEVRKRALPNSI
jgi:hypothetical protein